MKKLKRLVFFVPVIFGIAIVVLLANNRKPPVRPQAEEVARPVTIVKIDKMTIIPRVLGYGYVQPSETWEAIPEVSGRVIEIHPELKKGSFISKGDLLVRINPESYGLAQSRGEASLMSADAQLVELEQEKINAEQLLKIEEQKLQLAQKEFERKRSLFDKTVISASELEKEEKNLLAQQTAINNLKNSLALIPAKKKALLAQKESDASSLSELRLDLEKTVIRAPFDCRIAEVNIEKDQFASMGNTLLRAISIAAVEIPVQLSPNNFINLLSAPEGDVPVAVEDFSMERFREIVNLTAEVRLPLFSREAVWRAEFRRTSESIDLTTGAITVYVAVQRPYDMVIPGVRPPLVPNMYCEVELQGSPRQNRFVIPLGAMHEGVVYVVDGENRLQRREVEVEMVMKDMAVIRGGLEGVVRVVTTDIIPAIDGQLLTPIVDEAMMQKIESLKVSSQGTGK